MVVMVLVMVVLERTTLHKCATHNAPLKCRRPPVAQLVERETVVYAEISRSLVRIRSGGRILWYVKAKLIGEVEM